MTARAIQTVYQGYRFRSRLEARWAVFFDAVGVKWEYEVEGFDMDGERYLPDFWLPEAQAFIEIKPEEVSDWSKAAKFQLEYLAEDERDIIGLSGSPWPKEHHVHIFEEWCDMETYLEDCLQACIREKNAPLFSVLVGAIGHAYYVRGLVDSYVPKCELDDHLYLLERFKNQQLYYADKTFLSYCFSHNCLAFGERGNCFKKGQALTTCFYKNTFPNLMAAFKAARSARFEHGESPN